MAGFISNGGADLTGDFGAGERVQTQIGIINPALVRAARPCARRRERGNAYLAPNLITARRRLGMFESFDCRPSGGEQKDANDAVSTPSRSRTGQAAALLRAAALALQRQALQPAGEGQGAQPARARRARRATLPADPNQR